METALNRVREFHRRIDAPVADNAELLACQRATAEALAGEIRGLLDRCHGHVAAGDVLVSRLCLALEELAEWVEAHAAGDLVAAADAWGDRLYVLLGDAVAAGLPAERILDEVHRSNMTKAVGASTATGKGKKDAAFVPPDIGRALDR
jgi:predicted HAD superfamily Cof-like phosphohydrolase